MIIKVTRKHINKGKRHSLCFCPIALAIKEATGMNFFVAMETISCHAEDRGLKFELSTRAKEFIQRFDRYGKLSVAPASFRLDVRCTLP
jgi:hypothetical protein